MKTTAATAASNTLVAGPARDTSTPWFRGLRSRAVLTGTGLAHPNTPAEAMTITAGTMSVPTGSTCTSGLRLSRPARAAVSSPKNRATHPCETSWRMIDGITTKKKMISSRVMLWWATRAMSSTAPPTIHRVRLVF